MAGRARRNVETIVDRLTEQGCRFHAKDNTRNPVVPFLPAAPGDAEPASWVDGSLGPVPLTVSAWPRIVGDVWLVGTHPAWAASSEADPLVVELAGSRYPGSSMRAHYLAELDAWQDWSVDDPDAGGFVLPVAPDRLHKANISGGGPYNRTDWGEAEVDRCHSSDRGVSARRRRCPSPPRTDPLERASCDASADAAESPARRGGGRPLAAGVGADN